ncbi:thioesterase family protein [Chromobacterium alkanivorans]|uniref:thioesterase family protein n=1 Tax=Chromobacterium alkanivorans TaxID=1071719 RepID=UPI001968760B|nr:thioesterase family protein [Chromobacterium alkanivorans]MBN3006030.1 thioesterase family protein [Chromobacterium alkanivorans]
MSKRLALYRATTRPDWLDYNGHVRDAYYLLVFSHAVDALMERIGMDAAARERSGHTLYTVEAHLRYLREIRQQTALRVDGQLLAHDAKRLRLHLSLHRDEEADAAASCELMLLNVDGRQGRSAPFSAPVRQSLDALTRQQAGLPWPEDCGRRIEMT